MKTNLIVKIQRTPVQPRIPFFQRRPPVSPSLRLRATAANRSLLRWMRAAELAAWQDADVFPRPALNA